MSPLPGSSFGLILSALLTGLAAPWRRTKVAFSRRHRLGDARSAERRAAREKRGFA